VRFFFVCMAVTLGVLLAPRAVPGNDLIRENIVKIYVTKSEHDYFNPWQMKDRYTVEGSGAIIRDGFILTNAHLVSDNTFIQQVLGWEPNTPLRAGMAKTFAWIKEQYEDRKVGKPTPAGDKEGH